jgi:group I intron endonuclease
MYYTYVITDLNTGSYYVGSTGELDKRLDRHERELYNGTHHNQLLQQLFDAGHEMRASIQEYDSREEAYKCEDHLIRRGTFNKKCLNIGTQAIGGDNLTRHPDREDIISRIGDSLRLRLERMTEEERVQVYGRQGESNGMFGRSHTAEVIARLSDIQRGNSYATGSVRSEETRKRLSEIASARTGESNPFFGRSHTLETRAKLSEARKGNIPPNTLSVVIDGVVYPSLAEAGRQLGIPVPTIHYRIKSKNPKYSGYGLR